MLVCKMTRIYTALLIAFVLYPSTNAFASYKEDILNALRSSPYSGAHPTEIQPLNGAGSNTESVNRIIVKQTFKNDKCFICKTIKGKKKEIENLESLNSFICEYENYRKSLPPQFPPRSIFIAKYKGALYTSNQEFALFREASGTSVFKLMLEWSQNGYDWKGLDPLDSKNKLSYAFENIGYAIANFHLKHGVFDEQDNSFNSIVHGDLHTSNVFYDLWSNQTTFIDYETMAGFCNKKANISIDLSRLLKFSKDETVEYVKHLAGEAFVKSRGIYFLNEKENEEKKLYIKTRLAILGDFFIALKKGYSQAFKEAGLSEVLKNLL